MGKFPMSRCAIFAAAIAAAGRIDGLDRDNMGLSPDY
jgi:hypothetical protein